MGMDFRALAPRWLYFVTFTVSGFAGLIYESIWSHYLKLFLGHAALAQSLVLIIFMGGMAVGAWLASRYSNRWKLPLLAYAIVEAVIGVMALVFHQVFDTVIDTFYFSILPEISAPVLGSIMKWSAAALLIFPQSVLLGMTFPLMSTGILRRYPTTPGGSIAMLYFTNSIGAAVGVLASGFWLIGKVGLPGTIFTAGLLNIGLALAVWIMVKLDPSPHAPPIASSETKEAASRDVSSLFLIAAFITGAASFIYEIGWIRMLSLVLGSSTHSFELMLSAFITGLAFGGLWIKRRIDNIGDPVRFSGYVQIIMGAAAVLTLPVYASSFEWMAGLMSSLRSSEGGFVIYSLGSHLIALSVMLPATFLAGMTLPLFTHVIMKSGAGEKAIGRVYAANTVGAIVGVLFAINVGLPLMGMKNVVAFGALLDVVLGLVLLARSTDARRVLRLAGGAFLGLGAILPTLFVFDINKNLMASGIFRNGNLDFLNHYDVAFFEDGKTATVSVSKWRSGIVTIATNGKPDAAIYFGEEDSLALDEITQTMLGAIPLSYNSDARLIGVIGMGSGMTTNTMLLDPEIERVDTVEIEPKMAEAAKFAFGERNDRTFNDPRSRIHLEDAKTFFSLQNDRYDIVIAEPSNPWVSGVASLFSEEFYATVKNYIAEDGLFAQWLQLYEFTDPLVMTVLKAMAPHFSDYVIYSTGDDDIVVIAKKNGRMEEPDYSRLLSGAFAEQLEALDVTTEDDFRVRKLAEKSTIEKLFAYFDVPANSDYFPFLDLNAGKARFGQQRSTFLSNASSAPIPLLELIHDENIELANVELDGVFERVRAINKAESIYALLMDGTPWSDASDMDAVIQLTANNLRLLRAECALGDNESESLKYWYRVAGATLPFLDRERASALTAYISEPACWAGISGHTRDWLALIEAVAARDASRMAQFGTAVVESDELPEDSRAREYALSAAMLGYLESNQPRDAFDLFTRLGPSLLPERYIQSDYFVWIREIARYESVMMPQQNAPGELWLKTRIPAEQ